jgi:dTDP-4-amino-4,6-dideoxygalactose transaminase
VSVRDTFLPFSPPSIGEDEIHAVSEVLRSGWISKGPRTTQFEEEFASYVGAEAALGLNSCTAGLHLALLAGGVGPGDEVIVPTMTFCATANVVEHVGARPVLVDVEADTLNIDPSALAAAITGRTKAVMVVHYAGHPAAMTEIREIAEEHGVQVVEDAAHAFPASYRGEQVGAHGDLVAFSFYATKNLTTGEGGMLVGKKPLVAQARNLSLHGMSGNAWNRYGARGRWYYEVDRPGFKYNMSDIQAALGLVQLGKIESFQTRRRSVAARYSSALAGLPVELPVERVGMSSAWHLYPIRLTQSDCPGGRDKAIERLAELNIGTSVHFIPLHLHPYYRERYEYSPSDFPVAQRAFERLISLPLHPGLTDTDVANVLEAVELVVAEGT